VVSDNAPKVKVMIKFLIITQPRSGSSFFTSCLNSHSQIYCPRGSLFTKHNVSPLKRFKPGFLTVDRKKSPYYKYRSGSFRRQIAHRFRRNKLIHEFLSEWYARYQNYEAVGFKVNYSQISRYPATISWVKQNDVKIIHLVRNNLLKRHVSNKIAIARDQHHSRKPLKPIKVYIDPEILLDDFRRRQKRFDKYRKLFRDFPFLEVSYESMVADKGTETGKVLKFLGIEQVMPLTTDLVKVNPDSVEDLIENYDEVEQTLINTEFKYFLY
jgi:LPS sulfotransferase NodH